MVELSLIDCVAQHVLFLRGRFSRRAGSLTRRCGGGRDYWRRFYFWNGWNFWVNLFKTILQLLWVRVSVNSNYLVSTLKLSSNEDHINHMYKFGEYLMTVVSFNLYQNQEVCKYKQDILSIRFTYTTTVTASLVKR